MSDVLSLHRTAVAEFADRVRAVRPDQWAAPTPCTDWDVRALVNHLVVEQLWVPPMLEGRTVAEVGDAFDGDRSGDDPARTFDDVAQRACAAFAEAGALTRTVHLSYGDVSAEHYLTEMAADLTVHSWDLARAIGADERLDPDLVAMTLAWAESIADMLAASGMFAPPLPVGPGADPQVRLLALTGRRA